MALEIGGLSLSSCGTAAGFCRARAIDATYDVACRPLSRSTTCHVGRAGQEKGGIGAVEKLFLLPVSLAGAAAAVACRSRIMNLVPPKATSAMNSAER